MTLQRLPVLQLEELSIAYHSADQWRETVHSISLTLNAGEMLAVVGESGSGKRPPLRRLSVC